MQKDRWYHWLINRGKIALKKGQVGSLSMLPLVAITFVIAAVVFGVGFEFLADLKTDQTSGGNAANSTGKWESGLTKVSNKAPTIGLAVAAGIIISVVVGFLAVKLRG